MVRTKHLTYSQILDEVVPLIIVLRTKRTDETDLKRFIARLGITLEAYASGTLVVQQSTHNPNDPPASPHPIQSKDLLYSEALQDVDAPTILSRKAESQNNERDYIFLIWRTEVSIGKPVHDNWIATSSYYVRLTQTR